MTRIIAKFDDYERAVKAGGALLDHGMKEEDFDLLGGEHFHQRLDVSEHTLKGFKSSNAHHIHRQHKSKVEDGVTTTTKADAAEGAKKGGVAGIVLGAVGGLASLLIPGYGIVIGSGSLATAIGAALGTGAAGAVAGGVTGYLKDLGVDEKIAIDYDEAIRNGGAVIMVNLPSDKMTESTARELLSKYRADRVEIAPTAAHV